MQAKTRQAFPLEALKNGQRFWDQWRRERSRRALLAFSTLLFLACVIGGIANILLGSVWVGVLTLLNAPVMVLTFVVVLKRYALDWIWLVPYLSNTAINTYALTISGGLLSPLLPVMLIHFFVMGITLQSRISPTFFVGMGLLYVLVFAAASARFPDFVAPYDPTRIPARGTFFAALEIGFLWAFLRVEKTLSREVVEVAARAAAAEVELAKTTEIRDAKNSLFSHVSHELLTPLTGAQGFAELLQVEGNSLEDMRDYARRIEQQTRRAVNLVTNLLDFTALDTGQFRIVRKRVPILDLITEVVSVQERAFQARSLALDLQVEPDFPRFVTTDPFVVAKILNQVLGNALQFSEAGGAVVHCSSVGGHKAFRIRVSDTGRGIPESMRDRLFEAFTRQGGATEPTHGAGGLGLALSRRLARLLGGDVVLEESVGGKGSRFAITLPCTVAEEGLRSAS